MIDITLEEALSRASGSLRAKMEYSIDLIRKSEKMALRLDPENGFYNTFSGGKDSQCLYHLVKLAGVKAKTYMNLTSVDPPEVIRFVKRNYPDVELIKPNMSIYDMAKKKQALVDARIAVEKHALVQHALRVFDGELRDVKLPPEND